MRDNSVKITEKLKPIPTCSYCKKKGHIKSECWALQRKRSGNTDVQPSPSALTAVTGKFVCSKFEDAKVKPEHDALREEFKPFVFEGSVSIDGANPHTFRILRNTGASQSLLLKGVLPLS
jgi:hypothetical protein